MSEASTIATAVDLSRLPAPAVVAALDYEEIRDALITDFRARWPAFDALLESDPAIKLLEVAAYRELLLRAAINDGARSVMPAFATGSDLEHIAARFSVARLVITPATAAAPAVMEGDEDLRRRLQLAAERLPYAGMTGGGYVFRALTAAPSVKDASPVKRGPGEIDLVLLGRDGDGTVPASTIHAVYGAIRADDAVQLTDVISVRSATILPYTPTIRLRIRRGPDPEVVRAAAIAGVRAYAGVRHRVGATVYAQQLEAAASVGGVEQAIVDIADVEPGRYGAAWLAAVVVTAEIVG